MSKALHLLTILCMVLADQTLQILQPKELADFYPGGMADTPALFGIPPYGGSISGIVIYGSPDNLNGCNAYTNMSAVPHWPAPESENAVIMLIDRGGCNFVEKVRHAEAAGAAAAIVTNNDPNGYLLYMADDGTGGDIHIPSVFISYADGVKLKEYINPPYTDIVWTTISWYLPSPDAIVNWDFWTSSNDTGSMEFKRNFKEAADVLDTAAVMHPYYFIYNGEYYGCRDEHQHCGLQCTNEGRYCAIDPEEDLSIGLDGEDVVIENLRQICLWEVLNSTGNGDTIAWWDYVVAFDTHCAINETTWTTGCSDNILISLGLNDTAVNECVAQSGGTVNGTNTLLEYHMNKRVMDGVFYMPYIIINQEPYRGTLACPSPIAIATCGVLLAICSGYAEGSEPAACTGDPGCRLGVKRDECGVCGGTGIIDACGVCLSVESPFFNMSCAGCDDIPNSGSKRDDCGVCNGDGRFDQCGLCMSPTAPQFNKTCLDCHGVPHGDAKLDPCGVCGGDGQVDVCGLCLSPTNEEFNKTCLGCDGVPLSGKKTDPCGVCDGDGKVDGCGLCLSVTSEKFNKTCLGCDGVMLSGFTLDACGTCRAPNAPRIDNPAKCPGMRGGNETIVIEENDPFNKNTVTIGGMSLVTFVLIIVAAIFVVGGGIFCFMKRQQAQMRADMDTILHQYVPLERGAKSPAGNDKRPLIRPASSPADEL